MTRPPTFNADHKPHDILNAAGRWLADELGQGFRWVPSAHALKLPVGVTTTAEIVLRPSTWNYTGTLTYASLSLTIRDRALAAWRRRHGRDHSGVVIDPAADVVFSTVLANVYPDLMDVELFLAAGLPTHPDVPHLTLTELLDAIQTRILPRLLLFESPSRVAKELPDTWLVVEMGPAMQWAISKGDQESAELLKTRILTSEGKLAPRTELDSVLAMGRQLLKVLESEMVHFREYRDGHLSDDLVRQGHELTRRWIVNVADYAGPEDRVKDGELAAWATDNLPAASAIRQRATEFESAASQLRK